MFRGFCYWESKPRSNSMTDQISAPTLISSVQEINYHHVNFFQRPTDTMGKIFDVILEKEVCALKNIE